MCLPIDDQEIENAVDIIQRKADKDVQKHRCKLAEVDKELDSLGLSKKNKNVPLEDWERLQAMKKPLQSKKEELEAQEREFRAYVDQLVDRMREVKNLQVRDCSQQSTVKDDIDKLRNEFGLEQSRFRSCLPIYARKSDIIYSVTNNQVTE